MTRIAGEACKTHAKQVETATGAPCASTVTWVPALWELQV